MNSVSLFVEQAERHPDRMALWLPDHEALSFSELLQRSSRVQNHLLRHGLQKGDSVLLMDPLSPRLYAFVVACLSLGACVMFVEPWMKPDRIAALIEKVQPRFFVAGLKGRIWGLRLSCIRKIPNWIWPHRAWEDSPRELELISVFTDHPGILTFTSGTTGLPKGVVRAHAYLQAQHQVLNQTLGLDRPAEPDLCIFANFALANLASGRGSVIVPSDWKAAHLQQIQSLRPQNLPTTLTAGPAFLQHLMRSGGLRSLQEIHIGGALTDTETFEEAFQAWPEAHFTHLYGSSEAEPVALADAKEAVSLSKEKGFYQTLFVGKPVPMLQTRFESQELWIAGPHVGPEYWGDSPENKTNKRREGDLLWHNMGDRIETDPSGWWYLGRSSQSREAVFLEQRIYQHLKHSRAFVHPTPKGAWLFGESLPGGTSKIFDLAGQTDLKIQRDARHRARIDRPSTLRKGAPWALG